MTVLRIASLFFCNLSILRQTKPPHMWPGQWGCLQYASALWGQAFAVRGNPCSRLVCTGSTACVHPRTVHHALCSACALDFWSPASRECGWKSWTATGTRGQCVGQTCFFLPHPPGSFVPGFLIISMCWKDWMQQSMLNQCNGKVHLGLKPLKTIRLGRRAGRE